MKKYSYILSLSDELISAVNARDALTMQQKIDELETAYKKCFGYRLDCFEAFHAFVKMQLASMGAPDKPCGVGRADANPKLLLNDT